MGARPSAPTLFERWSILECVARHVALCAGIDRSAPVRSATLPWEGNFHVLKPWRDASLQLWSVHVVQRGGCVATFYVEMGSAHIRCTCFLLWLLLSFVRMAPICVGIVLLRS